MYAIIRTGGKQYRVQPGDTIRLERLGAEVGETVSVGDVLLVAGEGDPKVGQPVLQGARVRATVVEEGRGAKTRVFKYKKRKHYRRTRGHRQTYTAVRIEAIEL